MNRETPFRYCYVNYVSVIPVPPGQSREIIYVAVGPRQTTYMEEKHTQENK